MSYMAALKKEMKMAYKEFFRVFHWHFQRRTGQVTWARLPGFGITPNRLT